MSQLGEELMDLEDNLPSLALQASQDSREA